jgi:tRNA dimethylallyltransferase
VLYSTGAYARDAARVLAEIVSAGRLAIVCGGTGLYFRALLGGIDDMPAVDPQVRARWRRRMAEEGAERLHAELARRDPEAGSRIRPGDPQRILRALELVETTGGPLADLQRRAGTPLIDEARAVKIVLAPPRDLLRERIARRFDQMMTAGALDEARAFLARPGAELGTAARAIGIPELGAHLRGEMSLEDAVARAVTRSRQYAKRQDTWFRHQLGTDWQRFGDASEIAVSDLVEAPAWKGAQG